jgi:double-stranded uracil-DNA glycosylase
MGRVILPDVLAPGLNVVFCGTAAGAASARAGAYYAGPGNAFWPTLFETGLIPRLFAPAEFRRVAEYGIGLTDLVKTVSGSDAVLTRDDFDRARLQTAVMRYQPRLLAFTSKRAAREYLRRDVNYGPQSETIGVTQLFVLPSPSGAARGAWSLAPWRELAGHIITAK